MRIIQPLSYCNLNQQNDYQVKYRKNILVLGGTCMEDNIDYHGGDVQQSNVWQHTVEGCKEYCRKNYPNAPFFSWVSKQYAVTSMRLRCYCKTSDKTRNPLAGVTSGRVKCAGMSSSYNSFTTTIVIAH